MREAMIVYKVRRKRSDQLVDSSQVDSLKTAPSIRRSIYTSLHVCTYVAQSTSHQ